MTITRAPVDHPTLGITLMCSAVALWVVHDAISKWLTESYSVFQVFLLRSVFALGPIAIFLHREGGLRRLRTPRPGRLLFRGALGVTSFGCFLAALPLMPLPDVFAIVMAGPLLVTCLSSLILGEQVGWRRWSAVSIGFVAVLFMVRPGGDIVPAGALLLLLSVIFYALNMIFTRIFGRSETASTMAFYANLVNLAVGASAIFWVWRAPDLLAWALFGATGLLAGLAAYAMTQAFRIATPATLAPFEYTAMVWALVLGFVVWRELPSLSVLGSALVVVGSGIYVLHRERVRAGQLAPVEAPPEDRPTGG